MDPELVKKIRELPAVVASVDMSWNKTGSWSLLKPEFVIQYPPCQAGCPAHVPIREIMAKVREKDIVGAAALFLTAHPFPAITGRVCHHPCQQNCLRKELDGALEIRAIERYLGEFVTNPPELPKPTDYRVAVIGSGPSGLACAYYSRLNGHNVTVFESRSQAGGLLRCGIPPYRLSDSDLDPEIDRLKAMGIEFKTGVTVTGKFIEDNLSEYNALFFGIGAHVSKKLGIPGEQNNQVLSGLRFLTNYENHRSEFLHKSVAVIGGGNTAMDAARTSLRFGADVDILYRRTREEMPAIAEEIEGAIEERCNIEFLTAPEEIKTNNDHLELRCSRMQLGEPDESGRRRPVKIPDSEFSKNYDFIISSIGEDPDFKDFTRLVDIENNAIKIDQNGKTSRPFSYSGGDAAGYARSVVDAFVSGKKAAEAIHYAVRSKEYVPLDESEPPLKKENINSNYFVPQNPVRIKSLHPNERKSSFSEIISRITEDEAVEEAHRCFSCGKCTYCDNCVIFCPDSAIKPTEFNYEIKVEYCKGCGICIKECPRGAMQWRQKNE